MIISFLTLAIVANFDRFFILRKEKAQHGIGLESIRRALQRYQGVLTYQMENGTFVLKFSLPLQQERVV